MKKILFSLLLTILLFSCSPPTQTEQELKQVLNTPLEITMFDTILHRDTHITMQQLREKYTYLSVVYLRDGCQPCYPKFVEWHQKMEAFSQWPKHTVLFIIQADDYNSFINEVRRLAHEIDEKYHIVIDPQVQYQIKNKRLPQWMFNTSLLVDADNKIKMVGAPWINEDMMALFFKTVSANSEQSSINNEQ